MKYNFNTLNYLLWCEKYLLNKNSVEVLHMFKACCDLQNAVDNLKKEVKKLCDITI